MVDKTLPESEEIQQNELRAAYVGKYFQSETENGKQYSKCLISNCERRLPGIQIGSLETHLRVAHNMSRRSKRTFDASTSIGIGGPPTLEHTIERDVIQLKQNLSESADARKYFQIVLEDGKIFSKCLIKDCMRQIAGNHLHNLKRHLSVHDATAHSSDDEDEVDNTLGHAAVNDDTAPTYFRFVTVDGRLYSKCLIRGCKRRLAYSHLSSFKRHLRCHKMEVQKQPNGSLNKHKYFEYINENGKFYSKCLIDGCGHRLAGNHAGNLNRHLLRAHNIRVQITKKYIGIGKYFLKVEIGGKIFTKCLIKNCGHRMSGNNLENQKRHLVAIHKINVNNLKRFFRNTRRTNSLSTTIKGPEVVEQSKDNVTQSTINEDRTGTPQVETADERGICDRVLNVASSIASPPGNCFSINRDVLDKTISHSETANRFQVIEMQPSLLQSTEVRKYFERFDKGGKSFSRCLINKCDYHMTGNHLGNMRRHLVKAHNSAPDHLKQHSTTSNSSSNENCDIIEMDGTVCLNEDAEIPSIKPICSSRLNEGLLDNVNSEPSPIAEQKSVDNTHRLSNENSHNDVGRAVDVRKYFKPIDANGKLYSRCLREGCNFYMTGNKLGNLKRHLKGVHKMNIPSRFQTQTSTLDDVRKFYRTVIQYGKIQSVCLITGCRYRMAGKHLGNLKRHLNNRHNVPKEKLLIDEELCSETPNASIVVDEPQSTTSHNVDLHAITEDSYDPSELKVEQNLPKNVRKYFRTESDGSKIYSKCLLKHCECRIAGEHVFGLKRHLIQMHLGKSQSISTCRLCFEYTDNALDILADGSYIANTIRLHFPTDEVRRSTSENSKSQNL